MGNWLSKIKAPAAVGVCAGVFALGLLASGAAGAAEEKKPTVSADIVKFLKPAQDAIQKNDFDTGLAKAREGLAAATKPYDRETALRLIGFAAAKKQDYATYADTLEQLNAIETVPAEDKNKSYKPLAQIYGQQGNYEKAVPYAQKWVEAGGGSDAYGFLATLYLIQKDCAHGVVALEKSVEGREATETELKREYQCYQQLGDKAKLTATMESLEARFLTKEYLIGLMGIYEGQAADDHAMLNLFRLAFDRDFLTRESEFVEYVDKALDAGSPAEALKVMETGISKGAVKLVAATDRNSRMLKQAKDQTAEDKKLIASLDKEARAGSNGEADVKVGLAYLGLGDFDKAVEAIERGLKPERVARVKRVDDANMNLGIAYYKLGKKDEASKAFTAAAADPRMARAAKVWISALPRI